MANRTVGPGILAKQQGLNPRHVASPPTDEPRSGGRSCGDSATAPNRLTLAGRTYSDAARRRATFGPRRTVTTATRPEGSLDLQTLYGSIRAPGARDGTHADRAPEGAWLQRKLDSPDDTG